MNHIKKKYDPPGISKFRLYVGIGLALFFAPVFYAFQYVLREVFRILFTSERHDVWLLSDEEVFFYNWFFAALSLIIGLSIGLSYIFENPKRFRGERLNKRNSILNDQRVLQYSFLMWFLKLAIIHALIFGDGGYYFFSIYPHFNFPLILVLIALFFQSWNTVRLAFKKQSYKWMSISFLTILGLSAGMAKVDVVDYKAVNESLLALNMEHSYDLQLPHASYSVEFEHDYYQTIEYDLVRDKDDPEVILLKDGDRIRPLFNEEGEITMPVSWHESNPYDFPITRAYLRIDRRVPFNKVCQLLVELRDHDILFPCFAVQSKKENISPSIRTNYGVSGPILSYYSDSVNFNLNMEELSGHSNQIHITHSEQNKCQINNMTLFYSEIKGVLFKAMMKDPDVVIYYDFSTDLPLDDYIQIKSAILSALNHLRGNYSWDEFGMPFHKLSTPQQETIKEQAPIRIIELPALFIGD